jgi:hypothetical protein
MFDWPDRMNIFNLPFAGQVFEGTATTVLLQIAITIVDSSMIAAFFMLSYFLC